MKMEIEIVSREKIKPITPTPNHLRLYKISLLDQIIPPVYIPAVIYFAPNNSTSISEKIHLLKDSLSSTLTLFYPFAGAVRDAFSIDCNDEGLPFFVAEVSARLSDFLAKPDAKSINKLLPCEFSWSGGAGAGSSLGTVQLNCFQCGGIAVCLILAHHIGDANTISMFFKSWAANARGCNEILCPDYNVGQSLFPQEVALQKESYLFCPLQQFLYVGTFVTRRYVFDDDAISTLRAQSRSSEDEGPTRVEAMSAFIWKCFMATAEVWEEKSDAADDQNRKPFLLTHPVNLRRRAEPAYPENSFGNFLWIAAAKWTKSPIETELKDLVNELKRAMSKVDNVFMKRLETDNGYLESFEELRKVIPENTNWFAFSSWCKMGFYDIDFGWGKPVWLSGFVSGDSDTVLPNSATLMETRTGDGIEAWVILDEKYAATFENNEDLLSFACLNPSVL